MNIVSKVNEVADEVDVNYEIDGSSQGSPGAKIKENVENKSIEDEGGDT